MCMCPHLLHTEPSHLTTEPSLERYGNSELFSPFLLAHVTAHIPDTLAKDGTLQVNKFKPTEE